jgi:hypothetical protein
MMLCIIMMCQSNLASAPVCLLLFSFEFREVLVLELSPGRIGASRGKSGSDWGKSKID